ncbi:hypothetical protein MBCUT_05390 [Methanobrevibacter cuticularis]|uniref:Uncharacterized protein n=1 Tax=Methanobrevibacter cuticularis TaxID=47311 RepID=A0A166EMP9_9EURY|nr:hypothetical protein [Methanobrevibacter cuticularis]KZX16820.1 hypothetical protein MBCUT_05390 [Methanobrevibacter cuticularis]
MKEIVEFLEENVAGKSLSAAKLNYEVDEVNVRKIYSNQLTFSNLNYDDSSLTMDLIITMKELVYKIGLNNKMDIIKDFADSIVLRYEIWERVTNKERLGTLKLVSKPSNSNCPDFDVNELSNFKLADGVLQWSFKQNENTKHENSPAKLIREANNKLYLENGKLRFHYHGKITKNFSKLFEDYNVEIDEIDYIAKEC